MGEPEPHPLLAKATASLAAILSPVAFDGYAKAITMLLTVEIARWMEDYGFVCQLEVITRRSGAVRRKAGRIDLVGTHPAGHRLAIEIDQNSNTGSLVKLWAEAHAGAIPIWVRWHDRCLFSVPRAIGLIELRAERSRAEGEYSYRYRRTPHLAWSDTPPRKPYYRTLYQPPRTESAAETHHQPSLFQVRRELPRPRHVPPPRHDDG